MPNAFTFKNITNFRVLNFLQNAGDQQDYFQLILSFNFNTI